MKRILCKTKEGGFINERYEKFNLVAGYVTAVVIVCLFVALVAMLVFPPEEF